LVDAKIDKTKVNEVVLVGGSTRIPRVHRLVQDFFNGKEPCKSINGDEAVAYGATIHAGFLMGNKKHDSLLRLNDVTPLSQGVMVKGGVMSVVIPRNTTIPTTKELTLETIEDEQSVMSLDVYEGERAMAADNILRSRFTLPGLTLAPKGVTRVNVRFEIDEDGILHVSAEDKKSAHKENITIMNDPGRFSMEEIKKMVQEAKKYKAVDEEHRKRAIARNDIENLLYTMGNTTHKQQDSASGLDDLVDRTKEWLENKELKSAQLDAKKKLLEGIISQTSTQ
jgi:L1 cell adhesion molecule like protein